MQPDPTHGAAALAARSVSQWERALLAQWFAGTERSGMATVAAAYVSERSSDDPQRRNKIVIAERAKTDIDYLLHRPLGESAWILTCGQTGAEIGRFRTLPEALNTIRPHRSVVPTRPASLSVRVRDRLADVTGGR